MAAELWLPPSARNHKKAAPPKTGEAFGNWAGNDRQFLTLPGGGVLQFDLSKLTLDDFRSMRDHYQINASLTVLSFMMHRLDWRIECEDEKISSFIEENMRTIWTRLVRAMSQAYWAGYSPCVLQWENNLQTGKIELEKVKDLIPETARVNWRQVDGYAPPGHLPPKMKVYDGIKEYGGAGWPIPSENTLWYPLLMENGDHYGKKLLRPAFPSWFFSILIHLFSNRYFERFGEPVPVGRADYEQEIEMNGATVSGREAMEQILTNLRNRAVVVLPSDRIQTGDGGRSEYAFDIEYLESQMRGADFEQYMTRLDEEMTLGLFTPLLLLRGASGGGSYNLGVQQMQMYLWMLNALAGDMQEYINNFVIKRLKDFNFGPNAPKATWVYRQMGKENTETMRAVVTELIRNGGAKPDIQQLSSIIGLSMEEVEQLTGDPVVPSDPFAVPGEDDEVEPDNAPKTDKRTGRTRPEQRRTKPRGVGEPRATAKGIEARIATQVEAAFRKGTFGAGFAPSLGFRKRMEESIRAEGADTHTAHTMTEALYARMDAWTAEVAALGTDEFSQPEEFMALFTKMLALEVENLAGDGS